MGETLAAASTEQYCVPRPPIESGSRALKPTVRARRRTQL